MIVLKTENLKKKYKKTLALNDLNMTIREGDIYGFVGKNGSGKTTLIRIITGVAHQSIGSYNLFESKSPQELTKVREKIGAVVETPALYLNLNAYDNLYNQCVLYGIKNPKQKIEEVLKIIELEPLIKNHPKKKAKDYSLGMKQRLGIGMSLIFDPKFLVLDEPNNGLDPQGIYDMRQLLLKLNREHGVTILISSHVLSELDKLCTIFGFIDEGTIIQEISQSELHRQVSKRLNIKLNPPDIKNSVEVLKNAGYVKLEVRDDELSIFEVSNSFKVISILAKHEIEPLHFKEEEPNLEDYYLNLLGRKN